MPTIPTSLVRRRADHTLLIDLVDAIRPARPGDDGTNIGDAMALSLDALLVAPPKKKVLVLMTDGNNEPAVPDPLDPEQAAILARDLGVTVHTIAIGHRGGVVQGVDPDTQLPVMAEVTGPNLPLLERLAELTGGRSFVAADSRHAGQSLRCHQQPGTKPDSRPDPHPV